LFLETPETLMQPIPFVAVSLSSILELGELVLEADDFGGERLSVNRLLPSHDPQDTRCQTRPNRGQKPTVPKDRRFQVV
jgi:hypothetical protein